MSILLAKFTFLCRTPMFSLCEESYDKQSHLLVCPKWTNAKEICKQVPRYEDFFSNNVVCIRSELIYKHIFIYITNNKCYFNYYLKEKGQTGDFCNLFMLYVLVSCDRVHLFNLHDEENYFKFNLNYFKI